jgi:hypothetical protein
VVLATLRQIKFIRQSVDSAKTRNYARILLACVLASLLQGGNAAMEIRSMTDYRVGQGEVQEDQITAAIEKVTAQIPSSLYLAAALASMAVSVSFKAAKRTDMALFVGQWAAPFLILGIYNKLVKLHGSDGSTHA